jgi:hypothetical protein
VKSGEYYRFVQGHYRRNLPKKSYPASGIGGPRTKMQHLLKAEAALGHALPPKAQVHHVDGTKSISSPLVICENQAYHYFLHVRTRILRAGGDPNTQRFCRKCKQLKPKETFHRAKKGSYEEYQTICLSCFAEYRRLRAQRCPE